LCLKEVILYGSEKNCKEEEHSQKETGKEKSVWNKEESYG
jgi:hypothetical protein